MAITFKQVEERSAVLWTELLKAQDVKTAVLALVKANTSKDEPMTPEAETLFNLVKQAGADLGQSIGWKSTGGVCDGNNIAACGVPVIDTMGVRGGSIHSTEEFLIVESLAERAALSALTILRLAEGA